MSGATERVHRAIAVAGDLKSVVRSMKAMAASSIAQYDQSVQALEDYYRTVELGLVACFRQTAEPDLVLEVAQRGSGTTGMVIFGSDQGLVGRFNEVLLEFVGPTLGALPGRVTHVWALGERVQTLTEDARMPAAVLLPVPGSVNAITSIVGRILIEIETARERVGLERCYLFHNRPKAGASYQPVSQQLLPLDDAWRSKLSAERWPTTTVPEVIGGVPLALPSFIRGYLFVLLFKACAESLASENASRLAAMQRADKSIEESLEDLNRTFHRLRQDSIDEELFDVVSGFEALTVKES